MKDENKVIWYKTDKPFGYTYRIQMIVYCLFLIGCSCVLIFYVRIFGKWDKAPVILIESIEGDDYAPYTTYLVNEKEYRRRISFSNNSGDHPTSDGLDRRPYEIGELYIDYQVSNPNYVMSNRTLPLVLFSIMEILIGGIIVTITVKEFKKRREYV